MALLTNRARPTLAQIAAEFAKLGVIVFGSGYVLLAFVRKDLVSGLGWLSLRSVLDAVAAGQVTPGPVFSTATFLGYLLRGVPGALVATAAIFVPSFVLVAAMEPLVPRIRRSAWLSAALDGVVVAALGLMAGVTFDLARKAIVDPLTFLLTAGALVVSLRWRPNPAWLVLAGAVVGLVRLGA
jgi:chromate transporter